MTGQDKWYSSGNMEPYQILGGAEECHSSESGWTMYIGSPIDDDDGDDGDNDSRYNNGGTTHQADAEDESDDSMASDASSGPSHHGIIDPSWGNGKGGYGSVDFQQVVDDEEEYVDKESFEKKAKHKITQEKQIEGKKVEKKKEMAFNGSKGKATSGQGVGKVRKSYWVGKRK